MTYEEFIDRFQIQLNEQQLAAVKSVNNPTLLLAVPGSGKTTVLVTRLGYMIYCCGIEPERILTVTYTVAATKDMKRRFAEMFGEELANRLEFRTINGICAKIIRYYGNQLGKNAYELVTDEGYKTQLLSGIYQTLCKEYPTESDLKNLSTLITYIKNMMLSKVEIKKLGVTEDLPLLDIYTQYCNTMRNQSRMDYDDQMVYALMMLENTPEVLAHFQDIYQYICVDEAQDTSKIQHKIIEVLAGRYENLFMVGDEDQSIYGFRAAYPQALLDFKKNYANAQVLLMEENYRSNAKIVFAADNFIQKNEFRHKKSMKPSREAGANIQNIEIRNRKAQYQYLAKVADGCTVETAVLYRDNESILPLVDLLERNETPYKIKNADLTFFSHRVVCDIENIIGFAANQYDTERFMQIYYKLGLYMSKTAAIEACRKSEEKGISVLDAALRFVKIAAGTQKSVKAMQTHLYGLVRESADKAIYRIVHFMGYQEYLERAHIKDSKIQILEAIAANEPSVFRLVERLQELSVLIKEKKYMSDCNFILSTIHSSKGLEYDSVYLLDVQDGIFPESVIRNRKSATEEDLKLYEEERRLFYVGVTRAKNNLFIFHLKEGSTFTRELLGLKPEKGKQEKPREIHSMLKERPAQREKTKHIVTEAEYMDKLEELQTTGYIRHKVYGEGMIRGIHGDSIEVAFTYRTMKCKLKYMMEHDLIE